MPADPRTCRGLSRGCCHVAWSNGESYQILLRIFHSDGREWGREENPRLFYVLLWSEIMEKVSFSGSRISLILRCEWIISARASCTRKLLCLFCREKLCYKKTQTWVVGQKHKRFREFWTPFPLRDIRKNPRSMYARMPQAMAQFVLKVEKLSHIMVPTPVLEMARAYAPDYGSWSGIISLSANRRFYFRGVGLTTEGALTWGFTTEQQVYK